MKVVLEINNEVDLAVLLPLLERLRIPFTLPKTANGKGKSGVKPEIAPATDAGMPHPVARFIGCIPGADGDALADAIDREFNQIEGEW